ncbi:hypothetical protein PL81_11950 [Streptomyces sp. RSD-27]|nr:hypothetical protein PL81_11950 [Streptomyces sp. RSD-27]
MTCWRAWSTRDAASVRAAASSWSASARAEVTSASVSSTGAVAVGSATAVAVSVVSADCSAAAVVFFVVGFVAGRRAGRRVVTAGSPFWQCASCVCRPGAGRQTQEGVGERGRVSRCGAAVPGAGRWWRPAG